MAFITQNFYDVIYKTTTGRAMVYKRVMAPTDVLAKQKVKKEMKESKTFAGIITAIKL